jgi:hypothetical protein
MANTIEGEIVIAFPATEGKNWQILKLTWAQARYLHEQLTFNLNDAKPASNGQESHTPWANS